MKVSSDLLVSAKNYLDITWKTTLAEDYKLTGILARGMAYLDGIAGRRLTYADEGQPRALLLDYARYARAGALDEFAVNYLHELLRLQMHIPGASVDGGEDCDPEPAEP